MSCTSCQCVLPSERPLNQFNFVLSGRLGGQCTTSRHSLSECVFKAAGCPALKQTKMCKRMGHYISAIRRKNFDQVGNDSIGPLTGTHPFWGERRTGTTELSLLSFPSRCHRLWLIFSFFLTLPNSVLIFVVAVFRHFLTTLYLTVRSFHYYLLLCFVCRFFPLFSHFYGASFGRQRKRNKWERQIKFTAESVCFSCVHLNGMER